MKTIYKSKSGTSLIVFLSIILGGISILFIIRGLWLGLLIIMIVSSFILHVFLTTYYTLTSDYLQIRSGFFFSENISIKSIRKIEETNSLLSAPALSHDRLEIFYNKFDSVMISPKNKNGFIGHLKLINNKISFRAKA